MVIFLAPQTEPARALPPQRQRLRTKIPKILSPWCSQILMIFQQTAHRCHLTALPPSLIQCAKLIIERARSLSTKRINHRNLSAPGYRVRRRHQTIVVPRNLPLQITCQELKTNSPARKTWRTAWLCVHQATTMQPQPEQPQNHERCVQRQNHSGL